MVNIRLKYRDARRHLWLDVVGVYHYYPYGKLIENRTWEATESRFGFQGQERDDEIAGAGNSLSTLFRQNNTQTCNWLSMDPEANLFPGRSTYTLYGNNPINRIDPRGDADYFYQGLGYRSVWCGTDGISDTKIYYVSDTKMKKKIIKATKNGNYFFVPKEYSENRYLMEIPSRKVFAAMKNSYNKTKDRANGYEEGGFAIEGDIIYESMTGTWSEEFSSFVINIYDAKKEGTNEYISFDDYSSVRWEWHVHAADVEEFGYTILTNKNPSEQDKTGVGELINTGDVDPNKCNFMMIQVQTQKVHYFDNQDKNRGSIYWDNFKDAVEGNKNIWTNKNKERKNNFLEKKPSNTKNKPEGE